MPGTGSSRAKRERAAKTKLQQKAKEGVRKPRSGTSGAEPATGAAAPGLDHPGGTSSRSRRPQHWVILGQGAAGRTGLDHLGRNKQEDPPPPGQDHPGTSGGLTPRTGSSGLEQAAGPGASRTGSSGAEQQGPATAHRAGSSGEMRPAAPGRIASCGSTGRSPQPPGWSVQGKVAARGERNKRPRPRWGSNGVMSGGNGKESAMGMQ